MYGVQILKKKCIIQWTRLQEHNEKLYAHKQLYAHNEELYAHKQLYAHNVFYLYKKC